MRHLFWRHRRQVYNSTDFGDTWAPIVRELEITAPAIYNYYPRLDDLITVLIVDAFQSLADAMQAGVSALGEQRVGCATIHSSVCLDESRCQAVERQSDGDG